MEAADATAGRITRLAVVNRGEAAMRLLTAVAELNQTGAQPRISTIALYTDPDAQALYVRTADEALSLGPATYVDPVDERRKSRYLDERHVVDMLVGARADAVWVGWGFVAESASFAELCEQAGILYIGPHSATIRLLGDKITAKRLAESAGVPVVPWSGGPVDNMRQAVQAAARVGYPLVVKAAAGGGGRGIRIVRGEPALAEALESARREADLAFGDPTVFIERLIPAARHVEVQIVADGVGTVWALGVRDCSIQRRHQKVVEESASIVLDDDAEQELRQAAVRLATAAGYRNAGTVEFLVTPDGATPMFMEVNTRLQVEHPVTEMTTGIDLVKLQLHIAAGGVLHGEPPALRGHAIEARLCAEDSEQGFEPAPGRLAVFDIPGGTGVRVDTGVRQGDTVTSEFDSMIAKVVAWGVDRDEALARLRRALAHATVVVRGGTTNRSFLLAVLSRPEVREGTADNRWLDRLTAEGGHLPEPDPVALLQAAVEVYDLEHSATQAAFRARASRGGPHAPAESGYRCQLHYRGARHDVHVYRTGPNTYQVADGTGRADVTVDRLDAYQRDVTVAGRRHRVTAAVDGSAIRVDVDDAAHLVRRDDGGAVRSQWPAVVVAVTVEPGDTVTAGQPLAVLESMKMEAVINAPYAGTVSAVEITANAQVDAGVPLVRITEASGGRATDAEARPMSLSGLAAPLDPAVPPCERVYRVLRGYLLGYDLDPAVFRSFVMRQRRLGEIAPPDDQDLLCCEDGLLEVYADVCGLYRPKSGSDGDDDHSAGGAREYLLSYLQWLDADQAGLPAEYRASLERGLRRYGVPGLERTPPLEEAVLWMYRSVHRTTDLLPVVTGILDRRLRQVRDAGRLAGPHTRALLDRLAAATRAPYPELAELAHAVRFHCLDAPALRTIVSAEHERMREHLDALRAQADVPGRQERVRSLAGCRQPLRALLLQRWLAVGEGAAARPLRRALLEVTARRYYQIRRLRDLVVEERAGRLLCGADYDADGRTSHLVLAYTSLADVHALSESVAAHIAGAAPGRPVALDLHTWRTGGEAPTDADAMTAQIAETLSACDFGCRPWRISVAVTTVPEPHAETATPPSGRTLHATFRPRPDGRFEEEAIYRDLHPMLAERLDLWRLANFNLRRLPTEDDLYLFHGVARDNPEDHRLFALAEVRDLTAVRDASGAVTYPWLELVTRAALAEIRRALACFDGPDRPTADRIVLSVRPLWEMPRAQWPSLARWLAPLVAGTGPQKVLLRVRLRETDGTPRETVLHIDCAAGDGAIVDERPAGRQPIRPVTAYQRRILRAQRLGAPYPYELVRLLAPPPGRLAALPSGRFDEHDLAQDGELAPVDREPGSNTANVVVGLVTNHTEKVPEGMTRVAVLGDPTRGLGNMAEPECRRILAALRLAARLGVPVEWFALSSGARIAMDSGTENMDWIAAVLRGLIEFTQAGGEVNVVVTGVNVGAQPYWNAEATMLMHTRGILVMTPASSMVLTGKQALDYSGGVSAEDNFGIGGFDRIMGPNGQSQYWAPTLEEACLTLLRYYDHSYVVPGERHPRRFPTADPADRDVRTAPHPSLSDCAFSTVGEIFSAEHNPERKKPFDIRAVMRAVCDIDREPLERWPYWRGADTTVVWDAHLGGIPACLIGIGSRALARRGFVPADGPTVWTSGTLFPQSSRKLARALNAASGNRPVVVLANLSGFDGSPESMRRWQLEYGAEIGRAVTNFRGPIVFVVITRFHGGAFVVFSKRLNADLRIAAVEGSFASVIGGAPAAATVFAREVKARTEGDPRVADLRGRLHTAVDGEAAALRSHLSDLMNTVRSEKLGELAEQFDRVHDIHRAREVGSVDRIIPARELRPYLIGALEESLARAADPPARAAVPGAPEASCGAPRPGLPPSPTPWRSP